MIVSMISNIYIKKI